jgi:hypothetical protein
LKKLQSKNEKLASNTFKPLIKPLEEIKKNLQKPKQETFSPKLNSTAFFKKEEEEEEEENNDTLFGKDNGTTSQTMYFTDDETDFRQQLEEDEGKDKITIEKMLRNFDNNKSNLDTIYGVRLDPIKNKFMIGNSEVKFYDYNFIINKKNYKATNDLLSLLFLKETSDKYSDEDLKNYKEILLSTSAHKINYDPNNRINGNRGKKYRNIISKLINDEKVGGGGGINLMKLPKSKIDYVYWDDVNELVNRLKLLIASQVAGNNSHTNEIISIISELKESKIIE